MEISKRKWRRNRMGRPLSPLQIHQKNVWTLSKPHASRRHQAPRKAAHRLQMERPSLPEARLNKQTWTRDHLCPPVSGWKLDTEETSKQKLNKQRKLLQKWQVQQIKIPVVNTDCTGRGLQILRSVSFLFFLFYFLLKFPITPPLLLKFNFHFHIFLLFLLIRKLKKIFFSYFLLKSSITHLLLLTFHFHFTITLQKKRRGPIFKTNFIYISKIFCVFVFNIVFLRV